MSLPYRLLPPILLMLGAILAVSAESTAAQLSVEASDPDRDALHYRWSLASGPPGATARFGPSNDGPSGDRCSVTVDRIGEYVFAITVSDGEGGATTGSTGTVVCAAAAGGTPGVSGPTGGAGGKRGCGLGSGFTAAIVAGAALAIRPRRDRR